MQTFENHNGYRSQSIYGLHICYGELSAIVLAGLLHVAVELAFSTIASRVFNVAATIGFVSYVGWRFRTTEDIARIWGLERATIWPALNLQALFALPAVLVLVGWGIRAGNFPPPPTFMIVVLLYPLWGTAQQFALQNLLTRNLRYLVRPTILRALVAAALFAIVHAPLWPIVLLTFAAGFGITWINERRPNTWAAGLVHGILGALAYYFVLGRNPGERIWEFVGG